MKIDTREPGYCASCREPVYWRREESGKRNPYNAPRRCPACKGGGHGDVEVQGFFDEKPCAIVCPKCDGAGKVQESHFATCPNAGMHRRSS